MSAIPKLDYIYTPDEYLEFERQSDERHEFWDGYLFQMAGESLSHSRICINLAREASSGLLGKPCEAMSSNMKVRTSTPSLFSYPDFDCLQRVAVSRPEKKMSASTRERFLKFYRLRLKGMTAAKSFGVTV